MKWTNKNSFCNSIRKYFLLFQFSNLEYSCNCFDYVMKVEILIKIINTIGVMSITLVLKIGNEIVSIMLSFHIWISRHHDNRFSQIYTNKIILYRNISKPNQYHYFYC